MQYNFKTRLGLLCSGMIQTQGDLLRRLDKDDVKLELQTTLYKVCRRCILLGYTSMSLLYSIEILQHDFYLRRQPLDFDSSEGTRISN